MHQVMPSSRLACQLNGDIVVKLHRTHKITVLAGLILMILHKFILLKKNGGFTQIKQLCMGCAQ